MQIEAVTADFVRQVITKKGAIVLPSNGKSMYPYIRQGDHCDFELIDLTTLRKGEIVLFATRDNKLVAHRFVKKFKNQYLFKGDTNLLFDEPIYENQILGRMTEIRRNQKKIQVTNAQSTLWAFLILNLPILSRILRKITKWKENFQY